MQNRHLEAARFIEHHSSVKPRLGIVLGSGLGRFADLVRNAVQIPYTDIPHFTGTTVEGHEGRLVLGTIAPNPTVPAVPVAVLQGRLHIYEGHTMDRVVFPVRTLCLLGVDTIVLTNSAGAVNPAFRESDIMMITDHLNLMGDNPLIGPHLKDFGPRFPDLTEAYHPECQQALRDAARNESITLHEGVYAALTGPTYETPAEVRMLRVLGADAVGMSTVPEAIAANHLGVRVAALSVLTNLAAGISPHRLSHNEVMKNADQACSKLVKLLSRAIPNLPVKRNAQ
ncbi:MAG TPA: purine-nucleoside phosphorylase [Oligoflexia bacterium]|nr:purine-nucleoside phosphorylase [Oligoflexia bacterium]